MKEKYEHLWMNFIHEDDANVVSNEVNDDVGDDNGNDVGHVILDSKKVKWVGRISKQLGMHIVKYVIGR